MAARVVDVGNCGPDHWAICRLITTHFEAEVVQCHSQHDAVAELERRRANLVLVNRKLDCDYSDGVEVIRSIKAHHELHDVPVMLITNYPEHQQLAVDMGAEMGFGKLQFEHLDTLEKLAQFLPRKNAVG
ncbi:MAG: hypothetical protein KDA61_02145 [Planctomycetales bacterium]|nr:hypothetical protein [Planctomycetales bacterium]